MTHCDRPLDHYASFLSLRDSEDRGGKALGNTAQCHVCRQWLAYVYFDGNPHHSGPHQTKREAQVAGAEL